MKKSLLKAACLCLAFILLTGMIDEYHCFCNYVSPTSKTVQISCEAAHGCFENVSHSTERLETFKLIKNLTLFHEHENSDELQALIGCGRRAIYVGDDSCPTTKKLTL